MGVKKDGKIVYGDILGATAAGRPLLNDSIVSFMQKLGAPEDEATKIASTLKARWAIETAEDLKTIEPTDCGDACHTELEKMVWRCVRKTVRMTNHIGTAVHMAH
eukprot:SAG31_NODE_21072_length_558_cov_1.128540_2_plen_104_part_01